MDKVVRSSERPKISKKLPRKFNALLEACWHVDAIRRPSFSAIVETLDGLLEAHSEKASSLPTLNFSGNFLRLFSSNSLKASTEASNLDRVIASGGTSTAGSEAAKGKPPRSFFSENFLQRFSSDSHETAAEAPSLGHFNGDI